VVVTQLIDGIPAFEYNACNLHCGGFVQVMPLRRLERARQTWLGILPVLPYLILTLTAGGPHQHRLLRQCWGGRASQDLAGEIALQAGSEDRDGRCLACDWLAQTSTHCPAAPPLPHPVSLETPQLAPAVHPFVPTPLPHSSRAPPLA
jgi:hypothetical protein